METTPHTSLRPQKETTDESLPQRFTRIVIGGGVVIGLALRLIGLSYLVSMGNTPSRCAQSY